jgi:lipoate-protein ligase B
MASGNAKRKRAQQSQARHSADKSHARDRAQSHQPLPKVGTREEQEHLHRQRQADLVDFGRGGRRRYLGLGLVVVALVVLLAFLAVLILFT